MLTLADIQAARKRIAPFVFHTPVSGSRTFGELLGTHVYLKLEAFQKTGSFKPRGAFNRMLQMTPQERRSGVVAVSGGNHAQAVAYAARELDMQAVLFMPRSTPANYLQATRGYGAEIVLTESIAEAFGGARERERQGWTLVHPFADPVVIAGQGTIGLELLEDVPGLTDVVVSIGGGGLIGGIALAIKGLRPGVRIWGVETVGADSMSQALAAGRPVELPAITSIARTLGAPSVSEETLELVQRHVESVTVVPDVEAVRALRLILERAKVLTEPAASCTLAAAERLKDRFAPDGHVVLVLCGGNVGVEDLCGFDLGTYPQPLE